MIRCFSLLRDLNPEVGPRKLIRFHQFYRTIVCLYALQHHRKADPRARKLAALFLVTLEECLEYSRGLVLRYPRTGVRKLQHKPVRRAVRADRYHAVFWRELNGIRKQVVEHRAHLVTIGVDDDVFDVESQLNLCRLQCKPLCFGHGRDQGAQREVAECEYFVFSIARH